MPPRLWRTPRRTDAAASGSRSPERRPPSLVEGALQALLALAPVPGGPGRLGHRPLLAGEQDGRVARSRPEAGEWIGERHRERIEAGTPRLHDPEAAAQRHEALDLPETLAAHEGPPR